jgi:uncharacterized phiE125 gp8 family phage protein
MPSVTVSELQAHLNLPADQDTDLLAGKIAAAEQHLERVTGKAFLTQSLTATFDSFARSGLELPRSPVQSVTSVAYLDTDLAAQTVDAGDYIATPLNVERRTLIYPIPGTCWPVAACVAGAVTVTYSAGYGDADAVPAAIKEAIKLLAANWYENREAAIVGASGVVPMELPLGVRDLIASYQEWSF